MKVSNKKQLEALMSGLFVKIVEDSVPNSITYEYERFNYQLRDIINDYVLKSEDKGVSMKSNWKNGHYTLQVFDLERAPEIWTELMLTIKSEYNPN